MDEIEKHHLKEELQGYAKRIYSYFEYEEYQKLNHLINENPQLSRFITVYIRGIEQQLKERKSELEIKWRENPNHFETVYRLAALCELLGDKYEAIDNYYLALNKSPSVPFRTEIISWLKEKYGINQEDIPSQYKAIIKAYLIEQKIDEAVDYIYHHFKVNPIYQAELAYFKDNPYLQIFIIKLILEDFNDYPIKDEFSDYMNGNIYFHYQYYDEALEYFEKVDQQCQSPLVLRNLAYLYRGANKFQESDFYFQKYLKVIKGDENEG